MCSKKWFSLPFLILIPLILISSNSHVTSVLYVLPERVYAHVSVCVCVCDVWAYKHIYIYTLFLKSIKAYGSTLYIVLCQCFYLKHILDTLSCLHINLQFRKVI